MPPVEVYRHSKHTLGGSFWRRKTANKAFRKADFEEKVRESQDLCRSDPACGQHPHAGNGLSINVQSDVEDILTAPLHAADAKPLA